MSSIRLFLLGSLAERGAMHGHALRLLAEEEHIDMWTDFTVGAVYGALKRLAAENLVAEERIEREGNYPERVVWGITGAGRDALEQIRARTLADFTLRADPFDLAISRLDAAAVSALPDTLARRRRLFHDLLDTHQERLTEAAPHLTVLETHALLHQRTRIAAEIEWIDSLIDALPEIIHDETSRKAHHP